MYKNTKLGSLNIFQVIDFNVKKNKNNSDYNKLVDPDSLSGLVHYNIKLVEIECKNLPNFL